MCKLKSLPFAVRRYTLGFSLLVATRQLIFKLSALALSIDISAPERHVMIRRRDEEELLYRSDYRAIRNNGAITSTTTYSSNVMRMPSDSHIYCEPSRQIEQCYSSHNIIFQFLTELDEKRPVLDINTNLTKRHKIFESNVI